MKPLELWESGGAIYLPYLILHHVKYVIWKKSCKFWNKTEYGLNNDRWRWYSLPDNTQEPGDTPSYRIMLLWGVFWDRAFNWLAMVPITLNRYSANWSQPTKSKPVSTPPGAPHFIALVNWTFYSSTWFQEIARALINKLLQNICRFAVRNVTIRAQLTTTLLSTCLVQQRFIFSYDYRHAGIVHWHL